MATEGARNRFTEQSSYRDVAGVREVTEFVSQNPGSSALVAFGLGFGIGIAIGSMLGGEEPSRSRWEQRWDQMGDNAERLGHQIMDAIANVVPQALSRKS